MQYIQCIQYASCSNTCMYPMTYAKKKKKKHQKKKSKHIIVFRKTKVFEFRLVRSMKL